ncbi:MAG: efflux transporter periplasmic adaptor subunit, partial [Bacteroidales bacterium]|nr:efflux transporter periplasmic adaptor subunit [Bacteroidales bacterium]
MDRMIEKKKWTTKKILQYSAIAVFVFFLAYIFFFRDRSSRINVDKNQVTMAKVVLDKFQEFIPVDGVKDRS